MIYLYAYLGIGTLTLVVMLLEHFLSRSKYAKVAESISDRFDPNYKKWWWVPLHKIFIPALTGLVAILFWPLALFMKMRDWIEKKPECPEKPKEFAVGKEHLGTCFSAAEIEQAEMVTDPNNAAPRLPFGFLNPRWEDFKKQMQAGEEIWSFSAVWDVNWQPEIREGYAIVRGDEVLAYLVTRKFDKD